MASKTSAPAPKTGTGGHDKSYHLGDREAFKAPVQLSNDGLGKIKPGLDPTKGTGGAGGTH